VRIDAHQHFWIYEASEYPWISDDMSVLKQDRLPDDLRPELERCDINGTIIVQARHTLAESDFLLEVASENEFVRAVVGWVDLRASPGVTLDRLARNSRFKGVRYVLADCPELMQDPSFRSGLAELSVRGLVFDLLVLPEQLDAAAAMIRAVPGLKAVINHAGKPDMTKAGFPRWKSGMQKLSEIELVYCKLSGFVTEVSDGTWKNMDFRPWLETLVEQFGADRLMFGSDWPTFTTAGASYRDVLGIVSGYASELSASEQDRVFAGTAGHCYGIQS